MTSKLEMCTPHEILRPKLAITRTQVLELGPQDLETRCILILVASSFHPRCILIDEDAAGEDATNRDATDEDARDEDATDELHHHRITKLMYTGRLSY